MNTYDAVTQQSGQAAGLSASSLMARLLLVPHHSSPPLILLLVRLLPEILLTCLSWQSKRTIICTLR